MSEAILKFQITKNQPERKLKSVMTQAIDINLKFLFDISINSKPFQNRLFCQRKRMEAIEKLLKIISAPRKNSAQCKKNRKDSSLEAILKNPGLQHIAENIFLHLNEESLSNCTALNQNVKEIIDRPIFWLKKLSQVKSFSNYIDPWKAMVYKMYDFELDEKALVLKLKERYKTLTQPCWVFVDV